jgi:hypothetical protein
MSRYHTSAMTVLCAAFLVLSVPAQEPQDKPATLDPLPLDTQITWNLKILEDNKENYGLVKRTVSEKEVVWLVDLKSDEAEAQVRQESARPRNEYQARFFDEDGVAVASVIVSTNTKDVKKGERVRFILKLPAEDVMKKTTKVTIIQ